MKNKALNNYLEPSSNLVAILSLAMCTHSQGASLEAPFTQMTVGALTSESAMSVSAAWGDYDNDGWLDLFVGNFQSRNSLFRNHQDGTFIKATTGAIGTEAPAHANGAAWVDYDNDGWLDLLIANVIDSKPSLFLYRGSGAGSHDRMTAEDVGLLAGDAGRALAGAWADYDNDGHLDLFVPKGGLGRNVRDALYHNEHNGRFASITNHPIVTPALRSTQGAWADYDNDNDVDLLVTHAANEGNSLFRNDGQGRFAEVARPSGLSNRGESVGAAWGDYDSDGDLDLFILNLRLDGQDTRNFFYQNQGDGQFVHITEGELAQDAGQFLSCSWVDYDNDGWLDLFLSGAPSRQLPLGSANNRLYRNQGNGTFVKLTEGSLITDHATSAGAAWGDYNNDGFLDVFIASGGIFQAEPNRLYRNEGNSNSWIKLKCVGTLSNRSAIGTRIRVKSKIGGTERWQMRQILGNEGWLVFNSLDVVIGLGDATSIDTLRVEWPSGMVQEFQNLAVNRTLTLVERSSLTIEKAGQNSFRLTTEGPRQQRFRLESSTHLTGWLPVTSVTITNADGTAVHTHTQNMAEPQRFFRATAE